MIYTGYRTDNKERIFLGMTLLIESEQQLIETSAATLYVQLWIYKYTLHVGCISKINVYIN